MSHWLLFRNATFAMSFRKMPKPKSNSQAVRRRVISTVPFGGRPLIWGYGVRDLAELFQTTEGAVRKLIQRGRLVPDNLRSIIHLYAEWFKDELETAQQLAALKKECECNVHIPQVKCKACLVAAILKKEEEGNVALSNPKEDTEDDEDDDADCSCGYYNDEVKPDAHCKSHGHRAIWKQYLNGGPGSPDILCVVCSGGFTCNACGHWNDTETDCPCQKEKACGPKQPDADYYICKTCGELVEHCDCEDAPNYDTSEYWKKQGEKLATPPKPAGCTCGLDHSKCFCGPSAFTCSICLCKKQTFIPKGGNEPWCLECGAWSQPECICATKKVHMFKWNKASPFCYQCGKDVSHPHHAWWSHATFCKDCDQVHNDKFCYHKATKSKPWGHVDSADCQCDACCNAT